jgi:hypothetical protein
MTKTLDTTPFFAGDENTDERRAIYRDHQDLMAVAIGVTLQIVHGAVHEVLASPPNLPKEDRLALALELLCRINMRADIHVWMAQNMCGQTEITPSQMEAQIIEMAAKRPEEPKGIDALFEMLGIPKGTKVDLTVLKL